MEIWENIKKCIINANAVGINHILIAGDLNNDILAKNSKAKDLFNSLPMEQQIGQPTHVSEEYATCIDILATNSLDLVSSTTVLVRVPSLSQHSDIAVLLDLNKPKIKRIKREIFDYTNADWESLKEELQQTDWDAVTGAEGVDSKAQKW